MENENNISQELLETIERYLKDAMALEERASFERRMEENEQLCQQVEDTRIIFSGIRKAVLEDKLNVLHEDLVKDKKISQDSPKVFKLNFKTLSIAASVLILVGGFWLFNRPSKNDRLFNTYFEKPIGLPTVMGGNTEHFEFLDAMVEYKIGDYDSAIKRWEALLSENQTNDTLQFYLGAAYLAKGNQEKAIPYLNEVIANNNSNFQNKGFYYLGMAYIKDEKWDLAKEMLQNTTAVEAKQILKEFNQ